MGRRDEKRGALICGAYGMGNAGDEAVLLALVQGLRAAAPELPIRVTSRTPGRTARDLGVEAVHPFELPGLLRAMKASRLFLSGGGSLIQDVTSTRSLLYYLWTLRTAKCMGCRVMMIGCGIGPLNRPGNRRLTARVIRRSVDAVTLRDRASLRMLEALGVTEIPTEVTADPALLLKPAQEAETDRFCRAADLPPERSWFLLAPRPWKEGSPRPELLAAACARAWNRYGLYPVLLAMEPGQDRSLCTAVRSCLENRGVPCALAEASSDPRVTAGLIRRADRVLALRLHALILAAAGDRPLAGIAYDPKVSGFLAELEAPCLPLSQLTEERLLALTDRLCTAPGPDPAVAARLRQAAADNTERAMTLLR